MLSSSGDEEVKAKDQSARDARTANPFLNRPYSDISLENTHSQGPRFQWAMAARVVNRPTLDPSTGRMRNRPLFIAKKTKDSDPDAHPTLPGRVSLPKKRKPDDEPVTATGQDTSVPKKQKWTETPAVPGSAGPNHAVRNASKKQHKRTELPVSAGPSKHREAVQQSSKKRKRVESPVVAGPSKSREPFQHTEEHSEEQLIARIIRGAQFDRIVESNNQPRMDGYINRNAEPYQPPTYFLNQSGQPIETREPEAPHSGLISSQSIDKLKDLVHFFGNGRLSNRACPPAAPIRYPSQGRMAGKFHTWEPDEDRVLLDCVKKGMSQRTISKDFLKRRTIKSIQHRLAELRKRDRGNDVQLQLGLEVRSDPIVTQSVTSSHLAERQVASTNAARVRDLSPEINPRGQQKLPFKRDKGKARADGRPRGGGTGEGGVYSADSVTPRRPSNITPESCPQFTSASKAAVVINVYHPRRSLSAANRSKTFLSASTCHTTPPILPDDDIEDSQYTPGQQLRDEMQQSSQHDPGTISDDEFGFSQEDEGALQELMAREVSQISSRTGNDHDDSQQDSEETGDSADNPVVLRSDTPSSESDSDFEGGLPISPSSASTPRYSRRAQAHSYIDDEAEEASEDEGDDESEHVNDEDFKPPDEEDTEVSEVSEEWSEKAFRKTPRPTKATLKSVTESAAMKAKSTGKSTLSKPTKGAHASSSLSSASSSSMFESDSKSDSSSAKQSGFGSGSISKDSDSPYRNSSSDLSSRKKKTDSEDDLVKGLARPVLDRTVSGRFEATQGQAFVSGKGKGLTHGPSIRLKQHTEESNTQASDASIQVFQLNEFVPPESLKAIQLQKETRPVVKYYDDSIVKHNAMIGRSIREAEAKHRKELAKQRELERWQSSPRAVAANSKVKKPSKEKAAVLNSFLEHLTEKMAIISSRENGGGAPSQDVVLPEPRAQHRRASTVQDSQPNPISPLRSKRVIGRSSLNLAKHLFPDDEEDEHADAKFTKEDILEDSPEEESVEDEPEKKDLKSDKTLVTSRIELPETKPRASVSMKHLANLPNVRNPPSNGSQAAVVGSVQSATHAANMRRPNNNFQSGSPPSSGSSQSQRRRQRRKRKKRELNSLPRQQKGIHVNKLKRRPGF